MINIYKTFVRHNLEFCVQLWSPVPTHGNWATIMEIESVQRKFTRLIDGVGLMPYRERLQELKITTLIERRARGDLIEVFKIFHGICSYGESFFKYSRSGMNIFRCRNSSSINTFEMRVVKYWNKLPDFVKLAEDVTDFKKKLEIFKKDNLDKAGNFWELSDAIFDRINDENRQSFADFMKENPYIAKRRCINLNA